MFWFSQTEPPHAGNLIGAKFEAEIRDGNGHFGRLSAGRITPGIQQIIKGWLARISPSANKLLTAASVLTQTRTFDQLCTVAGVEEIEALNTLDELLTRQLLLEENQASSLGGHASTYNFSHQKVSEVVYLEAGAARRRILHRRAFATLKARAVPAADLAHHALNAGLLAETIHYSLSAGSEAMSLFAVHVALRHYEIARQVVEQNGWPETLSSADGQTLYRGLGRAYELVDKWQMAQQSYQALITYAQTIGASAMECLGLNYLAGLYLTGDLFDPPQAIGILKEAQRLAEQSGDQRGMAETALNLSLAARHVYDLDGLTVMESKP